jgi:hypothetical protein
MRLCRWFARTFAALLGRRGAHAERLEEPRDDEPRRSRCVARLGNVGRDPVEPESRTWVRGGASAAPDVLAAARRHLEEKMGELGAAKPPRAGPRG